MNLLLRLIFFAVAAILSRRRLSPLDVSDLTFRVWPNDLDGNMHMNNGRYLSIMDIGRFDLVIRAGLLPVLFRNKWVPVLGGAMIRFRRSLSPFQKYRLKTRLLCWDAKWVYMEQKFETMDGKLAAVGVVKGVFKGPKGSVATNDLLAAFGLTLESPPMPQEVRAWQEAEQGLTDQARAA